MEIQTPNKKQMETTHKKFLLDGKGFVELTDLMPLNGSCDMAVVQAARVSYLGLEPRAPEKDEKLLVYLLKHQHTSPFEQVEFKFRVCAPVVTWWQWVRHRTWNFNFQSGRYVEFEEDMIYYPTEWREQAKNGNKQMSGGRISDEASALLDKKYKKHAEEGFGLYQEAIEMGAAREQARLFLPGFSMYYTAVAKVDALNLMKFMRLRLPKEAQYEIRVYARAVYNIFKIHMPLTAAYLEETEVQPWLENPEAKIQFATNDAAMAVSSVE